MLLRRSGKLVCVFLCSRAAEWTINSRHSHRNTGADRKN